MPATPASALVSVGALFGALISQAVPTEPRHMAARPWQSPDPADYPEIVAVTYENIPGQNAYPIGSYARALHLEPASWGLDPPSGPPADFPGYDTVRYEPEPELIPEDRIAAPDLRETSDPDEATSPPAEDEEPEMGQVVTMEAPIT